MRCLFPCVATKKHPIKYIGTGKRRVMLKEHGRCSFLFPEGTPSSKGRPAYPITAEDGCFDCSLAKAAYMRMSQQLGKRQPKQYRVKLLGRRRELVRLALDQSAPGNERNACNWSIAAAKRLKLTR